MVTFLVLALSLCGHVLCARSSKAKREDNATDFVSFTDEDPTKAATLLLSGGGLQEFQVTARVVADRMKQEAVVAIAARRRAAQEQLETARHEFRALAVQTGQLLMARRQSLAEQWQRLAVAAAHDRIGKCCCHSGQAGKEGCGWQMFSSEQQEADKECAAGTVDYRDLVHASTTSAVLSIKVDELLDQCVKSQAWQSSLGLPGYGPPVDLAASPGGGGDDLIAPDNSTVEAVIGVHDHGANFSDAMDGPTDTPIKSSTDAEEYNSSSGSSGNSTLESPVHVDTMNGAGDANTEPIPNSTASAGLPDGTNSTQVVEDSTTVEHGVFNETDKSPIAEPIKGSDSDDVDWVPSIEVFSSETTTTEFEENIEGDIPIVKNWTTTPTESEEYNANANFSGNSTPESQIHANTSIELPGSENPTRGVGEDTSEPVADSNATLGVPDSTSLTPGVASNSTPEPAVIVNTSVEFPSSENATHIVEDDSPEPIANTNATLDLPTSTNLTEGVGYNTTVHTGTHVADEEPSSSVESSTTEAGEGEEYHPSEDSFGNSTSDSPVHINTTVVLPGGGNSTPDVEDSTAEPPTSGNSTMELNPTGGVEENTSEPAADSNATVGVPDRANSTPGVDSNSTLESPVTVNASVEFPSSENATHGVQDDTAEPIANTNATLELPDSTHSTPESPVGVNTSLELPSSENVTHGVEDNTAEPIANTNATLELPDNTNSTPESPVTVNTSLELPSSENVTHGVEDNTAEPIANTNATLELPDSTHSTPESPVGVNTSLEMPSSENVSHGVEDNTAEPLANTNATLGLPDNTNSTPESPVSVNTSLALPSSENVTHGVEDNTAEPITNTNATVELPDNTHLTPESPVGVNTSLEMPSSENVTHGVEDNTAEPITNTNATLELPDNTNSTPESPVGVNTSLELPSSENVTHDAAEPIANSNATMELPASNNLTEGAGFSTTVQSGPHVTDEKPNSSAESSTTEASEGEEYNLGSENSTPSVEDRTADPPADGNSTVDPTSGASPAASPSFELNGTASHPLMPSPVWDGGDNSSTKGGPTIDGEEWNPDATPEGQDNSSGNHADSDSGGDVQVIKVNLAILTQGGLSLAQSAPKQSGAASHRGGQ